MLTYHSLVLVAFCVGVLVERSLVQGTCSPDNCRLPNCRCWNAGGIPGNLTRDKTPQMIILTFEDAINADWIRYYRPFFNFYNPNRCQAKGTFFVKDQYSDYGLLGSLYKDRHEIGVNSWDGTVPKGAYNWYHMMKSVITKLTSDGQVNVKDIRGVRAPDLSLGGDDELTAMGWANLQYDSSCALVSLSHTNTMVWPFTYDFVGPRCDTGSRPNKQYPGKWEVMLADLWSHGFPCATPAACRNVTTSNDAFILFFRSFISHYYGTKVPFNIVINASWAKNDATRKGTIDFLQYIRSLYKDVWFVTMHQALQWVQHPTPLANISDFKPWQC